MPPVSEMEVAVPPGGTEGGLSRDDCLCPVCLEIFIEPVTLPCSHSFCKPCFLETVYKATLLCPICRKRVSTWARLNGRKKTLVNDELWRRVQAAFPMQCQRRLSGQEEEEEFEDASGHKPRVCQPGELRREYEDQISKLAEEKRALEEAERKASEAYIQHLLTEEEEQQAEERRREEERQLENDEKLARLLSLELNPGPVSETQRKVQPSDIITPAKKKANPNAGDIEKYLSPVPRPIRTPETSPSSSSVANEENSLHSEKRPLSTEKLPEPPMPELDFYGRPGSPKMHCTATASAESATGHPDSPPRGRGQGKRKSQDVERMGGEGEAVSKRSCPSSSPPRAREETPGTEGPVLLRELAQREEHLFSLRQQEEEDRKLALALQKQLDREEARRAVDRSKGSSDQYQLRQKPRAQPDRGRSTSTSSTTSTTSSTSSSSSSTSKQEKDSAKRRLSGPTPQGVGSATLSAPPSNRGTPSHTLHRSTRQPTLTDLFSNSGR